MNAPHRFRENHTPNISVMLYNICMTTSQITIYSASWCAFCHQAKHYFDQLGVEYTDKDIETNIEYAEESIEKSRQTGIPVIDIDGTIIVGFDKPKIDAALKDKQLIS